MRAQTFVAFVALPLVLFSGCSDDPVSPSGAGGDGGSGGTAGGSTTSTGGAGGGLAIDWQPCPVSSDATTGNGAFCATIPVPLDWNDPAGPQIDFFVKKLPSQQQPPRGQLWLLNGGPGYSGADFEGAKAQTVDIYLPDHRGTGRSSRLACPEAEADDSDGGYWVTAQELQGCVATLISEWGDNVLGFTTTNAARDLGEVIDATAKPGDAVLVLGASYGSIWGNRYLQLYPSQATGVVLDAFAVGLELTRDDVYFDELGKKWMAACGADAECAARLGADPWQTMTQTIDAFEAGACPAIAAQGWDRAELHTFWSFFFYTWDYRALVAPKVYRLNRCEARDVAAFQRLHDVFTQPVAPTAAQRYFSMMLSTHVMLSELWESPPPSVAELEDIESSANVAHGIAAPAQAVYDGWPRYPHDALFGAVADTPTPVLVMRGEYDFIPLAAIAPAIDHFTAQGATFVEIPNAPHSSGAAPDAMGGASCASRITSQFFADPTATLDTSCVSDVAALPLAPDGPLSSAGFGTQDPWDGTPPGSAVAPTPPLDEGVRASFAGWRMGIPPVR